jgi:NAD(P)-dependent dehydrogenase (short-subunit alcohol dehydrogenase family)
VSADRAEYCFSKTALSMMVKIFALRLGEAGIASYEVRPGVIRTDMTAVATARYDALIRDGLTPIKRWGEPDDVGRTVAALACGDLPFMTGDALHVDGGLHIRKL